jgi:hypothetical protein
MLPLILSFDVLSCENRKPLNNNSSTIGAPITTIKKLRTKGVACISFINSSGGDI